MLVRRSVRRPVEPERVLASVHDALGVTPDADVERDRWTSCLIDVGALESALVDEWAPERDRWDAPLAALRQLTDRVGDAAVSSWSGRPIEPSALSAAISQVAMLPLPACISVETPAGFANHALFPEMYADAAQRFAVELQPSFVVVIGIRSIGA